MSTETQHYVIREDTYSLQLEGRFWNCDGKHVAIVASITKGVDWAAYIGTDAPDSYTEDETLKYVLQHGCKLLEKDAKYFFPGILLPYRG